MILEDHWVPDRYLTKGLFPPLLVSKDPTVSHVERVMGSNHDTFFKLEECVVRRPPGKPDKVRDRYLGKISVVHLGPPRTLATYK
jgi:hypothetical protein